MSFNWFEYIDFCKEISKKRSQSSLEDAYNRSILSRAYYAVYNKAAEYYEKKTNSKVSNIKQDPHNTVVKWYRFNQDQQLKEIGGYLKQLKDSRKNADYTCSFQPNNFDTDLNLSLAETTFQDIKALK